MASNLDNRQIRVFISSTFRDMQEERFHLINNVFPRIKTAAEKRNVSFIPIDLRWGITEEQSKNGEVLQVCLEEIENCHPFFIGIIGNQYGSSLSKNELLKNRNLIAKWGNWIEQDIENELSFTEMEMQFGVLRSTRDTKALFFIKEGNDEEYDRDCKKEKDRIKLMQLKEKILTDGRFPVIYYNNVEELGNCVENKLHDLLNELYPENVTSDWEKERLCQMSFLRELTTACVQDRNDEMQLDAFLRSDNMFYVITGKSGSGKSSLIANWLSKHKEDKDWNILYHCVNISNQQCDYHNILKRFIWEISDMYNFKKEDNSFVEQRNSTEILENLFVAINNEKSLLIILDGINYLSEANDAKLLHWLPTPTENIKIILATSDDDLSLDIFGHRNFEILHLDAPNTEKCKLIVEKYLSLYRKKLNEEQLKRIVSSFIAKNTFALRTLLDELVYIGTHDQLDQLIGRYISSKDFNEFYQRVIEHYEDAFGTLITSRILGLIAASKNGMSETELMEIIDCEPIRWSRFYCAFKNHLIERNNLYCYQNLCMKEAVLAKYSNELGNSRHQIIEYFKKKISNRSYDEIPYQYYKLEDKQSLNEYLLDYNIFDYLYDKDEYELGNYWMFLKPYSLMQYLYVNSRDTPIVNQLFKVAMLARDIIGDYSVACEFFKNTAIVLKHNLGEDDIRTAIVYETYGNTLLDINQYDKAGKYIRKAMEAKVNIYGEDSEEAADAYYLMSKYYNAISDFTQRRFYLDKAVLIQEKKKSNDAIADYNSLINSGVEFLVNKDYSAAYNRLVRAKELISQYEGLTTLRASSVFHYLGFLYKEKQEYDKALDNYKKELDIKKKYLDESSIDIIILYLDIADVLIHMHMIKEAESFIDLTTDLLYSKRGAGFELLHAKLSESRGNLYCAEKQYDMSISDYDTSLYYKGLVLPDNHIELAITYNYKGNALIMLRRYSEALECFQKVLSINMATYGCDSKDIATAYSNIGLSLFYLGEYGKAKTNCEEAISLIDKLFGKECIEYANAILLMGSIHEKINKLYQALAYYDIALGIYEKKLGANHQATVSANVNLRRVQGLLKLD